MATGQLDRLKTFKMPAFNPSVFRTVDVKRQLPVKFTVHVSLNGVVKTSTIYVNRRQRHSMKVRKKKAPGMKKIDFFLMTN